MEIDKIINEFLPDKQATDALADFFALFADRTRMRILSLLSISNLCVNDVAAVLDMRQSTVSHQLQILRSKNLVEGYRQGKKTIYCITNSYVEKLLTQAVLATE